MSYPKSCIAVTYPDGEELVFTSLVKACESLEDFKYTTLVDRKLPSFYKGYYIRRLPLNPR